MTLKGLQSKAANRSASGRRRYREGVGRTAAGERPWNFSRIWDALGRGATDTLTIPESSSARIPVTKAAATALDHMDFMKQTLQDVAETNPVTGKLEVPVEKLGPLRQVWDETAAQAKVYQGKELANAATGRIYAMAADAVRDELSKTVPRYRVTEQGVLVLEKRSWGTRCCGARGKPSP